MDSALPDAESASLYLIEVLSSLAATAITLVPSSILLSNLLPVVATTISRLSICTSMLSFSEFMFSLPLLMKPVRSASANVYGLIWDIRIFPLALEASSPETDSPVLFLMNCPRVSSDMSSPPSISNSGSFPRRSLAEPFSASLSALPSRWKSLMSKSTGASPPPFARMSAAILLSSLIPLWLTGLSGMSNLTSMAGSLLPSTLYQPLMDAFNDMVASVLSFAAAGMSCLPQNLRMSFTLHWSMDASALMRMLSGVNLASPFMSTGRPAMSALSLLMDIPGRESRMKLTLDSISTGMNILPKDRVARAAPAFTFRAKSPLCSLSLNLCRAKARVSPESLPPINILSTVKPIRLRCGCLVDSLPLNFISLMFNAANNVSFALHRTMNGLPSRLIRSRVIPGREDTVVPDDSVPSASSVDGAAVVSDLSICQLAVESL